MLYFKTRGIYNQIYDIMATRIGRSLTPLNISGKDGLNSSRVEKCSCHIACSCAQQST